MRLRSAPSLARRSAFNFHAVKHRLLSRPLLRHRLVELPLLLGPRLRDLRRTRLTGLTLLTGLAPRLLVTASGFTCSPQLRRLMLYPVSYSAVLA